MILFLCKLAHEPVHIFLKKWSKIKIVLKKRGAFIYLLSLSIIIIIIYIGAILTPLKHAWLSDSIFIAQPKNGVCTTEKRGLHNRKTGFAQPKNGVCTTEKRGFEKEENFIFLGLHNRKQKIVVLILKI